ncbi:MAG: 2-hydroxychromene-2-carboxylate isomerase [Pseudomonadota bacterium]
MRIESLAHERGIEISWRPFLLGPIFQNQGWNDSPFNLYPEKGNYMWRDLERICANDKIPYSRPSEFPRNGLLAARVACCFANAAWLPKFVRSIYQANFAHDQDIANPIVVKECLSPSGEDPEKLLTEAQAPDSKQRLRTQTEEAARLRIFGAPSFTVSNELFWGNDRLEDALEWLADS